MAQKDKSKPNPLDPNAGSDLPPKTLFGGSDEIPEAKQPTKSVDELVKELDQLKAEKERVEKESKQHWERLLRKEAEMKNLERRAALDVKQARTFALEKFLTELLVVLDSFERALSHSDDNDQAAGFKEGMELTHKQMMEVLKGFSIDTINPINEAFNPSYHEAIAMQPTDECPPHHVIAVAQMGYTLHDRVLRPARVVVSQAVVAAKEEAGDKDSSG